MCHYLLQAGARIFDEKNRGVDDLGKIVRRDVGCHSHRDSGGSIDQQIGKPCRQDERLAQRVIVIRAEIDRFFVDVRKQLVREPGHADFGVTHGRGVVPVHRTEVPLAVDQRVPRGKILDQAHDRVIYGAVPVRMIFTDDVADDARRFLVGLVVRVPQVVHRVQHAPVNGLQPVARIGQGSADDHAHGVVQVGLAHFVDNVYRDLF